MPDPIPPRIFDYRSPRRWRRRGWQPTRGRLVLTGPMLLPSWPPGTRFDLPDWRPRALHFEIADQPVPPNAAFYIPAAQLPTPSEQDRFAELRPFSMGYVVGLDRAEAGGDRTITFTVEGHE